MRSYKKNIKQITYSIINWLIIIFDLILVFLYLLPKGVDLFLKEHVPVSE